MDVPTHGDTLSARFHGQWAFLANNPPPLNHGQTRSLPPSSSYLRSDRSSVSRHPAALPFHHLNTSRSSLTRNNNTASVGGHSYNSFTNPPQPVLLPIHHSDVATSHLRPTLRTPRRTGIMSKEGELPPLSAYSFEGILGSIREVIEEDLNGIAEILGQSRLVLADQHDSHLPPTGEIRAGQLPALAEASSSNERLAADDVLILNENASLVEGSQAGSAAYGLLERLQAVPRVCRLNSELATSPTRSRMPLVEARNSSPAVLTETTMATAAQQTEADPTTSHRSSTHMLRLTSAGVSASSGNPTAAVVSEIWLSAGADGHVVSDPPIVSESGRNYPLYSYDESHLFESPDPNNAPGLSFAARMQRLLLLRDLQGIVGRSLRGRPRGGAGKDGSASTAENHLRDILGKHPSPAAGSAAGRAGDGHVEIMHGRE